MFKIAEPILLHCISSLHAGSGSEIGLIDVPIQREAHTQFPTINSSSLKGAVRSNVNMAVRDNEKALQHFKDVFGEEPNDGKRKNLQAGAVSFSDARILLFPVKSMRGIFVWVTCPCVIKRWNREMHLYGCSDRQLPIPEENTVSSNEILLDDRLVLEEFTFKAQPSEATQKTASQLKSYLFGDDPEWGDFFEKRVVILKDDDFMDFVKLSTEVTARIRMNEKGNAEGQGLWYEERIPPETVFYSLIFAGDVRADSSDSSDDFSKAEHVMNYIQDNNHWNDVFQLGGNDTLGNGIIKKTWINQGGSE